jgi:hypothetical protein
MKKWSVVSGQWSVHISTLCVLGALSAIPAESFARLGETEKEIKARYGEPVSVKVYTPRAKSCYFKSGPFTILVDMLDGISVSEFIERRGGAVNKMEMESFLAANAAGQTWIPGRTSADGGQCWKRSDGIGSARLDDSALIINKPASDEFVREEAKSETKGF